MYRIKNNSSYPKWIAGEKIMPEEEKEVDVDIDRISTNSLSVEEVNEYECEECGKTFKTKSGLSQHEKTHKEEDESEMKTTNQEVK